MGSGGNEVIQNKPLDTQTTAAIQQTQTKTPYEQYVQDQFNKYTAWQNQAGPKDITSAPGMSDYLDIYGNAQALAAKQRVGDPTHAFTANLPGFNNQLQQQKSMEMYDTRAQALSSAFQGLKGEAMGEGGTAAQLETDRNKAYADAMLGYNQSYYGRPKKVPLWQTIANTVFTGLQTGAKVASAGAGMPV